MYIAIYIRYYVSSRERSNGILNKSFAADIDFISDSRRIQRHFGDVAADNRPQI